jgi:peptidyl-prolyl cis-trans isomerase D
MLRDAALKGLIDRKLLLQGAADSKFASPKRRWTR